jgi:hypothetical protein
MTEPPHFQLEMGSTARSANAEEASPSTTLKKSDL